MTGGSRDNFGSVTGLAALLALCCLSDAACRPKTSGIGAKLDARPPTAEEALQIALNPARHPLRKGAALVHVERLPDPESIAPLPVRSFLPPADISAQPRLLGTRLRTTVPTVLVSTEAVPLASTKPPAIVLPVGTLPWPPVRDPARFTFRITPQRTDATAPAATGGWDRPQISTDPTAAQSRAFALTPPSGLRDTSAPFQRHSIPDPFEQSARAELRPPPPDDDPPVTTFTRPAIHL